MSSVFYDFEATRIDGAPVRMSEFEGRVVLIVNTASACGFTPQLAALEQLHQTYGPQGLVVLGFPCNQFGGQDPGSNSSIHQFCAVNHGVSFSMMAKVDVNGEDAHPLFGWLKKQARGFLGTSAIKWNFTKFLVGHNGQVLRRYAPYRKPEQLKAAIEGALQR